MRRILFIFNPIAGARKLVLTPDIVTAYFSQTDFEIICQLSEYAGHATVLTKEYIAHGITDVVAIGGDGSLNDIAKVLIHSNVCLGIIPTGSGNGIARHLGIPCHSLASLDIIKEGFTQSIDAGLMNDRYFFSNSGLGIDADIINRYDQIPQRGWFTYARLGVWAYFKYNKKEYHVTLPPASKKSYTPALLSVAISNQYGYNFKIAPDASMADGHFEVQILPILGPIYAVIFAWCMMVGRYFKHKSVVRQKHSNLMVDFEGERIVQCDGEPIRVYEHITYQIVPNALHILIPQNRIGNV